MIRANKNAQIIGIRLFKLKEYIQANANRNNAVKREEMLTYLKNEGFQIERKALYNDLATLEAVFGLQVEYVAAKRGYILKNPPFEPYELRLMAESVQASKFITQEKANTICNKIRKNLADKHTQNKLTRKAYVAQRTRSQNDGVVEEADILQEAIEGNKKVQFRYFHYTPDKSKKKTYSKSGDLFIVNPFALYWDNSNYYLYAHDGTKFRYFRIDRMEKISSRIEDREFLEEYKEENVRHQKAKVFQMYGGKEYTVKMRFRNELADQVIDQFGADITMIPTDNDHFTVKVPIQVSPTFYAWVSTFGRKIKILEPENVVNGMRNFLQKSLDMYKD